MKQFSVLYSTKNERNSSIELLRIVAMSMILVWHFFRQGSIMYENSQICRAIVLSFLYSGVNVFVMISGYFGIRVKPKGFLNLYALVVIFILSNFALLFFVGHPIKLTSFLARCILPFTCGGYWYLSAYLGLYLTTPFINSTLNGLSLQQLRWLIVLFSIFNLISCGILGNLCNTNGYTYMQFVFMYLLGHWISRENFHKILATWLIILAVIIGFCEFGLIWTLDVIFDHSSGYFMRYNNVFVVLQSICILVAFTKVQLKSKIINIIASGALGCYLLQDGLFGHNVLYPFLKETNQLTWYLLVFILIWITSFIVTTTKNVLIAPLIKRVSDKSGVKFIKHSLIKNLFKF